MATDTIRTQAQLLTYLTPNNNTVPRTTALLAQTARDLIVTIFANTTFYSATALGFVGDNSTDNTTIFNSLPTLVPSGAAIVFAPGVYRYVPANMSTISQTMRFIGSSWGGTYFRAMTSTTGNCFTVTAPNVTFEHISLDATANMTSGSMIDFQTAANYGTVNNCFMYNYFKAVRYGAAVGIKVLNTQGGSPVSGSIAISIENGNTHYASHCIFVNYALAGASVIISILGTGNPNVLRFDHIFGGIADSGVKITAAAGQVVQIVTFVACDFDTCVRATWIHPTGGGVYYVDFIDSWLANTSSVTIVGGVGDHCNLIDDSGSGSIQYLNYTRCITIGPPSGKNNIKVNTVRMNHFGVHGGSFSTDNIDCITLIANLTDVIIDGGGIYATTTAGYPTTFPAGMSSYIYAGNNCRFCTNRVAAGVGALNTAAAANSFVSGNIV